MLAKSEVYELDTMIISETGDASTSLVGANNFLRLLSLLGMHNVTVGLSSPEKEGFRKEFPNILNRDADMLAGVIEDLPYYPMHVNGLRGSGNYGVDAFDLSKRDPECTPATCKGPIDATWRTRPTSTKYYKEALDRGVTTVLTTGTLTALNNVLHSPNGTHYLSKIESMHMMLGNYWTQPYNAFSLSLDKQDYEAISADCEANCTYDHASSKWAHACGEEFVDCNQHEGNSYWSGTDATANVLAALRHPDIVIRTVPWSTANWVGNCPDKDYLGNMTEQLIESVGTKESQLVLDMMLNLKHDAAQYNYGGYLTGGYWCAHAS